jgi:hypothetical protein
MNNQTVKKLKNIIGYQPDDPILKKHFKRLKKKYTSLSTSARQAFLIELEKTYNNHPILKKENQK